MNTFSFLTCIACRLNESGSGDCKFTYLYNWRLSYKRDVTPNSIQKTFDLKCRLLITSSSYSDFSWSTKSYIQRNVGTLSIRLHSGWTLCKSHSVQCGGYLCSSTVGALFGYFVEVFHVAAVQSQQGSEFGEQDACACPDARAGSRNQGHFAPQGRHLKHTRKRQVNQVSTMVSTQCLSINK